MNFGVAVALGGGGVEIACAVFAGEVEGVDGAGGADKEGLDAKPGVVDGAGRRGEVEDEIDRARDRRASADVVFEEAEARLVVQMGEIGHVAGAEIIDAEDGVALGRARRRKDGSRESPRLL